MGLCSGRNILNGGSLSGCNILNCGCLHFITTSHHNQIWEFPNAVSLGNIGDLLVSFLCYNILQIYYQMSGRLGSDIGCIYTQVKRSVRK